MTRSKKKASSQAPEIAAEEGYLKVAGIPKRKLLRQPQKIAVMETVRIITMIQMTRQVPNYFRSKPGHRIVRSDQVIKEGCSQPGQSIGYQRRRDITSEALQFGSMILAMENAGQLIEDEELVPRSKETNRNKCDKSRDSEKACEYQVSRIEQEDTGDHTDAAGRDDL